MTDQQQAGMQRTVFCPKALSTNLMANVAPHPWHARWPEFINSSSGRESFMVFSFFIFSLLSRQSLLPACLYRERSEQFL